MKTILFWDPNDLFMNVKPVVSILCLHIILRSMSKAEGKSTGNTIFLSHLMKRYLRSCTDCIGVEQNEHLNDTVKALDIKGNYFQLLHCWISWTKGGPL